MKDILFFLLNSKSFSFTFQTLWEHAALELNTCYSKESSGERRDHLKIISLLPSKIKDVENIADNSSVVPRLESASPMAWKVSHQKKTLPASDLCELTQT